MFLPVPSHTRFLEMGSRGNQLLLNSSPLSLVLKVLDVLWTGAGTSWGPCFWLPLPCSGLCGDFAVFRLVWIRCDEALGKGQSWWIGWLCGAGTVEVWDARAG